MLIFNVLARAARDQLATAGVCDGRIDVNREEPATSGSLPAANVFVGEDDASSDGDSRTGHPKYVHTTKLVVEVVDTESRGETLLTRLTDHGQRITAVLLENLAWGDQPNAQIEGVAGVKQIRTLEPKGDRRLGRVQVIFDVEHRSSWAPGTDNLAVLDRVAVRGPGVLGADIDLETE